MRDFSPLILKTLRNLLLADQPVLLVISGTSMLPYLKAGDRVWVRKAQWSSLRIGDLIVFERGRRVFTHRLIWKSFPFLITKGDNTLFPDPLLAPEKVLGKVSAFERDGMSCPLAGRRIFINTLLGYLHAGISVVGQSLWGIERLTQGKLKGIL
ncbi:MAG: signal peptidase I, partial [Anaerolineales bacterium]|nr:signal peptidase I [Anaerolineales bacterium]MDW8447159.1 signal peptidase I [Anaerolineales bacterium]